MSAPPSSIGPTGPVDPEETPPPDQRAAPAPGPPQPTTPPRPKPEAKPEAGTRDAATIGRTIGRLLSTAGPLVARFTLGLLTDSPEDPPEIEP